MACTRFCEQPGLPHVGGTKNPDIAAIVALAPDVVVVDEEENRREDADALQEAGLRLLVTAVRSVDDAVDAVHRLAAAAGCPVPELGVPAAPTPATARAFVPIWRRPWMSINADTYGASVLSESASSSSRRRCPTATRSSSSAAIDPPDVVLVPSEPYTFTDAHVDELRQAFPDAVVERVDGQDLFWWGTRTPGALERVRRSVPSPR